MDWPELVARITLAALGTYGLIYLLAAIGSPDWFLNNLEPDEYLARRKNRSMFTDTAAPWWIWLWMGFTLACLGVVFYSAFAPLAGLIPSDWVEIDEYGETTPTRTFLQAMFAFFASVGVIKPLSEQARDQVRSSVDAVIHRALVEHLGRADQSKDPKLFSAHLATLLDHAQADTSGFRRDYIQSTKNRLRIHAEE